MSEPTLLDVLKAIQHLDRRFDEVERRLDEHDARFQTLDRKVDTVHGVVRQVQRQAEATHGLVQILFDAHGAFRLEYLREHPGGGHAA
jgi:hypothetical protein